MIGLGDIVRKIYEELGEASFCGGVVAEDGGECSITEWFRKALSQGLSCAGIITKSRFC